MLRKNNTDRNGNVFPEQTKLQYGIRRKLFLAMILQNNARMVAAHGFNGICMATLLKTEVAGRLTISNLLQKMVVMS